MGFFSQLRRIELVRQWGWPYWLLECSVVMGSYLCDRIQMFINIGPLFIPTARPRRTDLR